MYNIEIHNFFKLYPIYSSYKMYIPCVVQYILVAYFIPSSLFMVYFPTREWVRVLVTQSCPTLQPHGLQPARLLFPWDFPGKNTGVGCHFLLQGIFWTQGLNLRLLHWQADCLPLSHLGSPNWFFCLIFSVAVLLTPQKTPLWYFHKVYRVCSH